jgi:hypothetical protein
MDIQRLTSNNITQFIPNLAALLQDSVASGASIEKVVCEDGLYTRRHDPGICAQYRWLAPYNCVYV